MNSVTKALFANFASLRKYEPFDYLIRGLLMKA